MQTQRSPSFHPAFRRSRLILHAGVVAGMLIAILVAYLVLMHLRHEAEERAASVTQSLTQAVDQTIDGLIDTIDVILLASSDEISRQMSAGKINADSITRSLVRQQKRLPIVDNLRASNERGESIYGLGSLSPPVNVSDREYFFRLRDDPNTGLFISKPVVERHKNKWVWLFSRRINKPDGSFGGVVFASVLVANLEQLLAQIKLEPGSAISIRDAELGLIARSTFNDASPIQPGDKRLSTSFKDALKLNPQEGTFISDKTTPDGVSRTYSYRRNPDYGYTINVGLARTPMLAEWRYQTRTAVGLASVYILLSLSFSLLIGRAWRRQEQDVVALKESEHRFRAIIEAAPVACALNDDQQNIIYLNAAFIRTFGYTLADIPTVMAWWPKAYPDPAYRQWAEKTWLDRLAIARRDNKPFEPLEVNIQCKDGSLRTMLVGAATIGASFEELHLTTLYDITERKLLEQEREQYFRFFRLSTDAMAIADPFGCFKKVNPALMELTGYAENELIAKPFLDFILPEDRQRTTEEMQLQVAVRPSMYFENRYVCKDGRVIVLSWTAYFDKNDGVTYATARDITALRQAEERLERFFTLVPDLMCIASIEGYFLKFNPAWQEMLGYSEQEIATTPYINYVHPDDRSQTAETISKQVAGEAILNFVNRFRCRDGSYRWLEWRTTPVINDAIVYATARDITARMQMEAALQESEARFRHMFEHNDSVMLLIDPGSGEIVDANAAAARFYGYPVEHLKTLRIDQINTLSPEEVAEKRAQAVNHDSNSFIFPHRLASGEVRTVEVHSSPIEVGVRILLFSIINDITERELALAELKRSNAELEQFSFAISHDMRQPLRMISSYLQLLGMELAEQLDGEKREYFDFAIDGAKRLDRMLVQLLEYSRVGRLGEPPMWVESRDLLDDTLMILQPEVAEAQARIAVTGDWPRVCVSRDEMLRLMQNLIGNALKFRVAGRSPEITVTSGVVSRSAGVSPAFNEAGGTPALPVWRMSVSDNGVGIIADQIGRLFQVFQRLQGRTKYEGTGVGLALCRKIAEHHHGRIWAESSGENKGSTFRLELPLSCDQNAQERQP